MDRPPRPVRGRADELTAALTVLRRTADTGQGAVLLVSGEGGIGKTALLREICGHAGDLGYRIGIGRAEESDQIAQMAAVLLALRSGPAPLLSHRAFGALAAVQRHPLWLTDAIVDALEAEAARQPTLICIDDVQWADHASLFALRVLPGRLAGSPIVWLIATRPTAGTDELARSASRDVAVARIPLRALTPAAIEQLAVDRLGDVIDTRVQGLLAGADGVPFLAVALLDGLATRVPDAGPGDPAASAADRSGLPDSLVLGVRARLETLPAPSVQLVRIGAVLGRSFLIADAAALLGGPQTGSVLPWLEPVVRAGILDDTGDLLVFRHDLLRQAVYADLLPSVRRAQHRAAAEHFLHTGRTELDAAGHVMRSAAPGDTAAIDILRRAARATSETAPETAADLAQRAFSLSSPAADGWGECGLEALALLNAADRGRDARALAERLLAGDLDDELAARVQIVVAHSLWARGELIEMQERVDAAQRLAHLSDGTRARLLALRALSWSREPQIAVADAEEALAAGERSQDAAAQTTALQALGEMARNEGSADAALAFYRRMRVVAGMDYLHDEVLCLQLLDRLDESAAILAEAEARANAAGRSSYPPDVSFGLMWQSFMLGRLEDTEIHAQSLLRSGDELRQYTFHSEARALLCRVAQMRGDLVTARAQLVQATAHIAVDVSKELLLTVVEAWLSHAEGRDDEALAATRSVLWPAHGIRHRWLWQPGWLLPGLQIAMRAGDLDLARDIASLTEALRRRNPGVATNAALAQCAVGLTTGSTEALVGALEVSRSSPRLMTRAQITTLLGQALLREQHHDAGVAALDDAWDLYTSLGAHGEARGVQALLQGAGVRRRRWAAASPRPADGWESLTSSEQRVARLIAAGHTNRSAAQVLVLSPNTIATHLRSVFHKLGVTSRVQLSLAVAEIGE
ncbi:AAA family ATPase [Galbitalea sp. SE-J8]|uniref:helix-turn-helix transcriptional regulator n=1 Tax=Galbitalea sp. SE-J8 TaxID=3054952 RepID=UPI00259CA06C|nr:LuxR family transcriptional regulator [Galbitalea sp. SE-J8]MDM4762602.1 AAA family ATPase [Galbitalea sp. SE-J8]